MNRTRLLKYRTFLFMSFVIAIMLFAVPVTAVQSGAETEQQRAASQIMSLSHALTVDKTDQQRS